MICLYCTMDMRKMKAGETMTPLCVSACCARKGPFAKPVRHTKIRPVRRAELEVCSAGCYSGYIISAGRISPDAG